MNVQAKVERLEKRLADRPGLVRRIVYVRPGEPEPEDVPAGTLVVRTRVIEPLGGRQTQERKVEDGYNL